MKSRYVIALSLILAVPFLVVAETKVDTTDIRLVVSASNSANAQVVEEAKKYMGVPYVLGGTSKEGLDCSGLVYAVYRALYGADLPRTVEDLMDIGKKVDKDPQPADLLFFDTTGEGPSHVAIYIGGNRFVHAASDGPYTGVIESSLFEDYYRIRYLGARRLLKSMATRFEITLDKNKASSVVEKPFRVGTWLVFALSRKGESNIGAVELIVYRNQEKYLSQRKSLVDQATPERLYLSSAAEWMVVVADEEGTNLAGISFASSE